MNPRADHRPGRPALLAAFLLLLFPIGRAGAGDPALSVAPDLDKARVYPNPWRADQHAALTMTFDRLPAPSVIKIFTLSGHKVRTLSADNGAASWDRTNDAGDKVASGLYLYVATDPQGHETRGKLAILR